MDSKEFVEYLKSTLSQDIKVWENSILSGTLSKDLPFEKAIGMLQALKNVVQVLDNLHENFMKSVSLPGDLGVGND